MKSMRLLLLLALCLAVALGLSSCGCDDDDDDDSGGGHNADDDAADDDNGADDDSDDDDDDDNDTGPPVVNCVPPLDYDGDGDVELLLRVNYTDSSLKRLYFVEPGTFERGEPVLEYDLPDGELGMEAADFDGNDVWDLVAVVEDSDGGDDLATYDVYLNGDFTAPAHVFGPYVDVEPNLELLDVDGNGLPEMLIDVEGTADSPRIVQLIDADNDFSVQATFTVPSTAVGGDLTFLPERRLNALYPVAGSVTGQTKGGELVATVKYEVGEAMYLRVLVYDTTDGALLVQSDPYSLGDDSYTNDFDAADIDGDGLTEVVLGLTEQIQDPASKTAFLYVLDGPDLAQVWTLEQADAWGAAEAPGDYNLDGVIDPLVGHETNSYNDYTRMVLNGTAGYAELFGYQFTSDTQLSSVLRQGRGNLGFAYDYRGTGTEMFVFDRQVVGSSATGRLRSVEMSDGSFTGALLQIDLEEDGRVRGNVVDLGGDGVLDLVVTYVQRYQSGGDWAETQFYEVLTAPDFYEAFHEQMSTDFTYMGYLDLDLSGDLVPDLVVRRQDKATSHVDYLFYPCDSNGCGDPTEIDYGANESFFFVGPML